MRILTTAAVAALCASSSFAQFATNGPNRGPPAKALASRAPPPPGGGFLMGASVTWPVSGNTTYTIQLGTFPGAAGGSGTFDIMIGAPPLCGQYDDGSTENALGLTAGGEMMWLHSFDCGTVIDEVSTAYGTLMFPGSVTNGNASRIAVYEELDCDNDPTTGAVLLDSLNTVIVNGDTDLLNPFAIGPVSAASGCSFIGATADQVAGEFPGPMDQTGGQPVAWVVGSTTGPGSMDIADLNNNSVPPLNMNSIGFPCFWLLRAHFVGDPGEPFCFGAQTPMTCPCGNIPAPGAGCGNGTFPEGAVLSASGTTSPDTIVLHAQRATPNQPGLFFQGDNAINGGIGIQFGDGLRCVGTNVIRLQVVPADGSGNADTSVILSIEGGVSLGETKHYQYWYRDPALSPCGQRFNLTNGYTIPW